jgi:hypothetical protein
MESSSALRIARPIRVLPRRLCPAQRHGPLRFPRQAHLLARPKSGDAREEAEDQAEPAEEFRGDGENRKGCWDVHHLGEECHRLVEAAAAQPAEHLLGTVGKEDDSVVRRRIEVARSLSLSQEEYAFQKDRLLEDLLEFLKAVAERAKLNQEIAAVL